ncbi:hypothetical protein SAMN04488550_0129 [Gordonia malaquae]|uniref:Leucine-rich repeat domain-containing protein n=1 Tax=Gordonia malaquae NBRC 108250 TaxID=1223542 RepID=M3VC75_GORML|nr:STM4015 family protein [Gordonia malaquae]GAC81523.1 hypothetical protein GM1_036_00230 [Gordonia malaquae NBRC 108250]SEB48481.1 hypothetical protein SAMN04488550_0129 [Gordonia malaquae]
MVLSNDLSQFHGLPVVNFPAEDQPPVSMPETLVAWRVSVPTYDSDPTWSEEFERFLSVVDPSAVTALVVGGWNDPYDVSSAAIVESLVAAAPKLTALRALFIGDMTFEDCEISWIVQSDLTALLTAYPNLNELGIRGGTSLELQPVRHAGLNRLLIESGGLPAAVVRAVAASDFPNLTDLELWLGTEDYGGDASIDDVAPILQGDRLPALKRLALRNSDIETEIASAVAVAAITARIVHLDLSMGVLLDEGAEALLAGQSLDHLESIDLTHNYLTDSVRQRIVDRFVGKVQADAGDADADEYDGTVYRSVAVGE